MMNLKQCKSEEVMQGNLASILSPFHRGIKIFILLLWLIYLSINCSSERRKIENRNVIKDSTVIHNDFLIKTDTVTLKIGAVGDIMVHQTQLNAQKNVDGNYDFNNNFQKMKLLFENTDVLIGNLETTFAGKENGFQTYPLFNTPDELASAMKNAGFSIISTANNHSYDSGTKGVLRTIDVLQKNNINVIGTRTDTLTPNYLIRNIKGIRVGFVAYTYESSSADNHKLINGIKVDKDCEKLINSFNPGDLDNELLEIKSVIENMKHDGAEIIIFVVHWGDEYALMPNKYQRKMAQKLNDFGVDVIFGSHPHVAQPIEFIKNDSIDKTTFVVHSMGNFISNQRFESLQNYHTEDGLFVVVELQKNIEKNGFQFKSIKYEPTWVYRYQKDKKYFFEVLPVVNILNQIELDTIYDSHTHDRLRKSFERTSVKIESPLNEISKICINKYLQKQIVISEPKTKN